MQFKTLTSHNTPLFQNPTFFSNKLPQPSPRFPISLFHSNLSLISTPKNSFRNRIVTASRISSNNKELIGNDDIGPEIDIVSVSGEEEEEKVSELGSENIWKQMKEIVMFTGPATGLWICGPLMSLIDTAVIGQGSSIELAALGPGTVVCDYMSYIFMFLSIATSNMVATALAKQDKNEVQHHISILLFVGLTCGCLMLLFTKFFGSWVLTAFTGLKNAQLISAANIYVQIQGLAWPALLVGWVAQSASLGMKDSWGPLKALAVASAVNGVGDIVLCSFMGYGIAGAAWATMASQSSQEDMHLLLFSIATH
ncbi:protein DETOXIFICATION 46, chloroplastic-like [Quercus suber]|uniref:protein DETOXIFICATION 46, chloroplastic-like n=1 Tax=Quercus suber TaxID=58331 RepID=UPI0032DF5E58